MEKTHIGATEECPDLGENMAAAAKLFLGFMKSPLSGQVLEHRLLC